MYTYQYMNGVSTYNILRRSFTNYSCLIACVQFRSLAALLPNRIRLNYFRCYTFEAGNDDDVTGEDTSANVVCTSTPVLLC